MKKRDANSSERTRKERPAPAAPSPTPETGRRTAAKRATAAKRTTKANSSPAAKPAKERARPSGDRPALEAKDAPSAALRAAGTPDGDDVGAAELGRQVAESLRRIRKARDLSLDELAAASGVSRAAISQIEGSRTNPTLAVLWKLAVGLGVPFGTLLGERGDARCRLLRARDAVPLRSVDGRIESRLLTPAGASPGHEIFDIRLAPRGVLSSDAHAAGTTETVILLTGALRMTVGDEVYDLAPGDSFHFRADAAHTYENRGSHETRFLNHLHYRIDA